ncbi:ABC transporter permease [Pectinatus haikarae]|uniref:Peptide/nickel transport system permease protein n=1 Tax=Pectinatus haikarae TaxID=349096 RepID=A0ABT9Y9Z8_9FIRM|nr:ABC transporter permease [Pectinatus haikarae]MDQ0204665.1 peptide/nickel transport system permease protein [Pectinatus haikarae]
MINKTVFKTIKFKLAVLILTTIIIAGIAAPLLVPFNPFQPDILHRLQFPGATHLFGTDSLGRDLFSRILFGSRYTILLALLSSLAAVLLGTAIGCLAGYYGKWPDTIIMLLSNIFQGIPGICFMVAIAGFFGPGLPSLLTALIITSWVDFSRIIRTETLKLKGEPFIEGLICIGCSNRRIIINHIVPNMFSSLLILGTMRMSRSILSISALSFLGLGVQPPAPDWSVMVSDALVYYRSYPHLLLIPGGCILALIYSLNAVGESLREAFDVRFNEVTR